MDLRVNGAAGWSWRIRTQRLYRTERLRGLFWAGAIRQRSACGLCSSARVHISTRPADSAVRMSAATRTCWSVCSRTLAHSILASGCGDSSGSAHRGPSRAAPRHSRRSSRRCGASYSTRWAGQGVRLSVRTIGEW